MSEEGGRGMEKRVRGLEGGRRERSGSESSASSLDVWMKRKRDGDGGKEGEGERLFAKSRKTVRSPGEREGKREEGCKGGRVEEGKGGIWEELEKAREEMRIYMEKVKKMEKEMEEWRRREEMLRMEGERMKERMSELEKRIEEKKLRESKINEEKNEAEIESKWEGRLRVLEKSMEGKEREDRRRRNIIIKGVPREKDDWRWGVEKLLKEIGAEVKIGELRRINTGREDKGEMVWLRLEREEDKRLVWENKKKLKGRNIWIEEDLSWKEREVRRKLGVIAAGERRKGKKVWVEVDRIKIERVWWRWDEEKGSLARLVGRREQGKERGEAADRKGEGR